MRNHSGMPEMDRARLRQDRGRVDVVLHIISVLNYSVPELLVFIILLIRVG